MELERKFLIKQLPLNYSSYQKISIEQIYLCYYPEIRIRKANHKYYLTIKSDGDLSRREVEIRIPSFLFKMFYLKYKSTLIKKDRYYIPLSNGHMIELDIYQDKLLGLITAEVEFKNEKDMINFILPDWFGEEVTYKRVYKNKLLSKGEGIYFEKA